MINTTEIIEHGRTLCDQALTIWISGGWSMPAIALVAFVMFSLGVSVNLRLQRTGFQSVSEKKWRRWIDHPAERKGRIGRLLNFVTGGGSLRDTTEFFRELSVIEVAPFERDLRVMKICVGVAPLLGLLGTVTGMLATFSALSSGSGGDKTMALVAEGISEALITTETGLVIALPGMFFQHLLARKFDRYQTFLAHLETICTQKLYKDLRRQTDPVASAAPSA